tara:strand:+ start:145481 stop:145915 length:435 start_codon:yes stop_codon:yes gene_type:complete
MKGKLLHITIFTLLFTFMSLLSYAQKGNGTTVKPNPLNSTVNTCQLYVATAFTPNDDGINDKFIVKYNGDCELLEFDIKIFDRWGRLVYESEKANEEFAWDGTNEGSSVKEGVYMWKVYAKMIDPQNTSEAVIVNKQGTVVLIR